MNSISLIKDKLKRFSYPKSENKKINCKSRINCYESFELDISIINENNAFINKPKKVSIGKNLNYNQVRFHRKGSLYDKSNESPNNNCSSSVLKRQNLPSFSNLYLKNHLDNVDTKSNEISPKKQGDNQNEKFTEIEENLIMVDTEIKEVLLPKIKLTNNDEDINKDNFKAEIRSLLEKKSKILKNNLSCKNEFFFDNKVFSIDRFNKHLEDEINLKINKSKKRINKSINLISSNVNKIYSFNNYLSIKMAKENKQRLLTTNIHNERGIEVLSKKFYEKIKKENH